MTDLVDKSGNLIFLTEADIGKWIRVVEPGNVMLRVEEFDAPLGSVIHVEHVSLARVTFDMNVGARIIHMERFYPEILGTYGVVMLKCVEPRTWNLCGALKPKPEWQLDVDSRHGLGYALAPYVDVDWAVALAEIQASLETLNNPPAGGA